MGAEHLRDREHQVGSGGAFGQATHQLKAHDLRDEHGGGLPQHGRFGLDSAHAPAQDSQPIDHGGVTVGTKHRVGIGPGLAVFLLDHDHARQVFQVDLVDNARAGRHHFEPVEGGLAPAQECIPLLVAVELDLAVARQGIGTSKHIDLDRVVDHKLRGNDRIDPGRIPTQLAQGVTHGRQVHHAGDTGEILQYHPGGQEGDFLSPTQPYSVDMPSIGTEPLSEAKMWGMTFLDQLYCRIEFRKMRYQGEFTPPTTKRSLIYPGYYGGLLWGGVSIDETTGILFVNDMRMPQWLELVPREDVEKKGFAAGAHDGFAMQEGAPYGVWKNAFLSPLGVPCHQPPYGTMSAIDLKTRTLLWQRPMGSIEDSGPLGIKTGLHAPIGMPTLGGPLSTAGGLVFFAGTQDYYLRALDSKTGTEIWRARLPVGAQATPISYISPESGRQFIVISAGGARMTPDRGDYVIAYALPKKVETKPAQ